MKFFLFVIALSYSLSGYTQIKKMYLNAKDEISDSSKAVSYVLFQKVEDSIYLAQQFNLHGYLILKGSYKDENLSKPTGKFSYYRLYYIKEKIQDSLTHRIKVDTINYLYLIGYFIDGKRKGNWIEYYPDRSTLKTYSYLNDKLNGESKTYSLSGMLYEKGNFINDKKEGEWNTYSFGTNKPVATDLYSNNKKIKTRRHFINADIPDKLNNYLTKSLKPYIDSIKSLTFKLSLNKDGKIDTVWTRKVLNNDIAIAVSNIFINGPHFYPATYDGVSIASDYLFDFDILIDNDKKRDKAVKSSNDTMKKINEIINRSYYNPNH